MKVLALIYSMVQSPSWAANWFAASQIPCISWNPKVHYCTHKRSPPVSILGQHNPVHIPTSHLLEIHPNIIHPPTPRFPQWFLSLRFPHQDPIHPPLLTHKRHMPSPSHYSWFYHPHDIGWGVQNIPGYILTRFNGCIYIKCEQTCVCLSGYWTDFPEHDRSRQKLIAGTLTRWHNPQTFLCHKAVFKIQ